MNISSAVPNLDFRFCHFYAASGRYHLFAGYDMACGCVASPGSAVYLNLEDCNLKGGRITLGKVLLYTMSVAGAVTWVNNLFDNVTIDLDPDWPDYGDPTLYVDLSFQADNNLFRGGGWFHLEPIPASAGNWVLKDNLFDRVNFFQDATQPLDFNNNGYWPLSSSDLVVLSTNMWWALRYEEMFWWWGGNSAQLTPTITGGGANEVTLTAAPPYQTGPFGNYYLPNTTPLYGAGSDTPANLGLYHYTTRLDQMKEGNDTAKANANIGLHYIAATNGVPIDTDGDGIPDYVENWHGDGDYSSHTDSETDWQNPTTATDPTTGNPIPDAYNTVYDDIDLDGNGLTGRAERILGTNPLIPDNPLTLTPVITGQEPYILTYSMPLSIDMGSNHCVLKLLDNGQLARGYSFYQTNGAYRVQWDSTMATYGPHVLQVKLSMPGVTLPSNDTSDTQTVNLVLGTPAFEISSNLMQLDPDTSLFDSQAWIYGILAVQSADYKIEIYDTNNVLLTTITNHTDSGVLDEVWNLVTGSGETRNDPEFNGLIYITPTALTESSAKTAAIQPCDDNGPPPVSFPIPCHFLRTAGYGGDAFTMACGWNPSVWNPYHQQMIQNNVVNVLFNPGLDNTYNNTFLNTFDGNCFWLGTTNDEKILLDDLANGSVRNFYWDGHGGEDNFGSARGDADHANGIARIDAGDLETALLNVINADQVHPGWTSHQHPYRLVILNSCSSAADTMLANLFGIVGGAHDEQWFNRENLPDQAFVGWVKDDIGPIYQPYFDYYGAHLNDLFELWMDDVPLEYCLIDAATPNGSIWSDMPLDSRWKIYGNPLLTRDP